MNLVKLGLASILTAGALFAGTYNVDPSHSNVGFKVKHMVISNVKGQFDKFSGTFDMNEKTNTITSLTGLIEVSSLTTANANRDKDLKSAGFFDAENYPTITFKLIKLDGDTALGELTMKGVTKKVELDFENNGMIKDPWGNTRVGLALDGKISRKEFGLTYNALLEAGGAVVGDTIKLSIELEGILAK